VASPYIGLNHDQWQKKTDELIADFPLSMDELVEVVKLSWDGVFASRIGKKGYRIGKDLFPKPQIVAFILHELIPRELQARHPALWRGEESAVDKDIVYIPDRTMSIEIKTSSHKAKIYGNRSYAQTGDAPKKDKSGYYLAINFEALTKKATQPVLRRIRFGWIDHSDWRGQIKATGQQANLSAEVERGKLRVLFE